MAVEKLNRNKSSVKDQIPVELIKAGVEQFDLRTISLLVRHGIRRNCLRNGRSRSFYLLIRRIVQGTAERTPLFEK